MKNKRFFILILIAMICCTLLFSVGCGCGKDNNNDGTNEQGQDSPVPEKDNTSPVITLNSAEREFSVNVEEALVLPVATAYDKEDGDVSKNIIIIPASGSKFCKIVDGKFYSEVGGRHEIFYVAIDSVGNETFESIYVDVRAKTAEKSLENGWENDLSILNTSQGVFFENFEKGPDAPLTKSAWNNHYTLTGGEDAISGNSLIIDYSKVNGNQSNKVYLSNTAHYLSSGIWSVSFDLKSLSDNSLDDLYFAYSLVGGNDVVSYGRKLSDNGFIKGQTVNVSLKMAIEVEEKNIGNYVFYIYRTNAVPDKSVVVLDNFKLMREDLPFKTYSPTINELENGFTYDWTENKYATLGTLERISEIDSVSVRTKLTESEYFGESAMVLSQSARLNGITANINPDYFEPNKVYTITIPYYSETAIKGYLSVVNEKANNRTIGFNIFNKTGEVGIAEIRYIIGIGEQEFIIYTPDHWDNLYIGNISIRRSDRIDEKVDTLLYSPTAQELKDGYTFDFTSKVISLNSEWTDVEYYKVGNDLPDSDVILPTEYFTRTYVLRLGGYYTTEIKSFENGIAEENTYTVRMKVYCDNFNPEEYHLLVLDANKEQINKENTSFNCVSLGNNMYELSATVEGNRRAKSIAFYSVSYYKFYVSEIMLKADADDDFMPIAVFTAQDVGNEQNISGITLDTNKYSVNMDKMSYMAIEYVNVIEGVDQTGDVRYLHATANNMPSTFALTSFADVFTEGKCYKLTLVMTQVTSTSYFEMLFQNKTGSGVMAPQALTKTKIDDNWFAYTVYFKATADLSYLCLFDYNKNDYDNGLKTEFYLKSINLIMIEENAMPTRWVFNSADLVITEGSTSVENAIITVGASEVENVPQGTYYHIDLETYENNIINNFNGQFKEGHAYTVYVKGYIKSYSSSLNLMFFDNRFYGVSNVKTGIYKDGEMSVIVGTVVAAQDSYRLGLFVDAESHIEMYVAFIEIIDMGENTVINLANDNAKVDFSENQTTSFIYDYGYSSAYLDYGEDNVKGLHVSSSAGAHTILGFTNNALGLSEGTKYELTIVGTDLGQIRQSSDHPDQYSGNLVSILGTNGYSFDVYEIENVKYLYRVVFIATTSDVLIFNMTSCPAKDFFVYSVQLRELSVQSVSAAEIAESGGKTITAKDLYYTSGDFADTGFDGEKIYVKASDMRGADLKIRSFNGAITEGNCYKVEIVLTGDSVVSNSFNLIFSGVVNPIALDRKTVGENTVYGATFKAVSDTEYIGIRMVGYDSDVLAEICILSVNVELIEESLVSVSKKVDGEDIRGARGEVVSLSDGDVSGVPAGNYYLVNLSYGGNTQILNFDGIFEQGHSYRVSVSGYRKSASTLYAFTYSEGSGGDNGIFSFSSNGDGSITLTATIAVSGTAENYKSLGLFNGGGTELMYVSSVEVTTYYTVTFKVDGNNYGEPKLLKHGDKIEMPKTPSKQDATNDYSFDGWFLGDTKWDFDSDTVEFDVELNAKWKIGATYTEDFLPSGIN